MEQPSNPSLHLSDVFDVLASDMEPYIKIIEQPASKALRFRYECEGRSAGSIPGVNSSPENKTYPTIQICNYKGPVVVVVSCVTKEGPPYKAHPHNLVGRDGCKQGICSLLVNSESMVQHFDHLGIQCVKKKDIEEALKVRKQKKVDPFNQGFSHSTTPGSIDLNAVRLCFQAFTQTGSLLCLPVVSEVIYDKKALCDLTICKLSHCSAPVAGGLEMILLCEKVAKEDISVWLFEEDAARNVVWQAQGDFSPAQVHKQVAITFKTPAYKNLHVDRPVQVSIQLRRPSDNETSDPLPFQLTPLDSGRPAFWSLRRYKADYRSFSNILTADTRLLAKVNGSEDVPVITCDSPQDSNNNTDPTPEPDFKFVSKTKPPEDVTYTLPTEKPMEIQQSALYPEGNSPVDLNLDQNKKFDDVTDLVSEVVDRGFDDLIEEVDNFDDMMTADLDHDDFTSNNEGVYSSFQMAMKNPFDFTEYNTSGYEDVIPPRPSAAKPLIISEQNISESEVENVGEVLPPLPPKRIRKSPPNKTLPPVPENKKLSIFQKLFSSKKKEKSRKNSVSSIGSRKSLTEDKPVLESVENDDPDDVTLTEAEHYALYTAFAPHATASEFDETSFYYSPVEGHSQVVK